MLKAALCAQYNVFMCVVQACAGFLLCESFISIIII